MTPRETESELPRRYEGEQTLAQLLAQAGSPLPVHAIKDLFRAAHQEHAPANEVFPRLFPEEPRFATPRDARRLYGNLFGLWDRVGQGRIDEPHDAEPATPLEPVAPPGPIDGAQIPEAFVEAALGALTTLPEKERRRHRDRFEQRESELLEVLRQLGVSPGAELAALDLAFELWLLAQWALGERSGRADFSRLRKPDPRGTQPALDAFVSEWLGEAELDEDEPLPPPERAVLEPVLRQAAELFAPT